jgi:acyl-CoA synthetase (AMP-forming)/AMP-acid ligase II
MITRRHLLQTAGAGAAVAVSGLSSKFAEAEAASAASELSPGVPAGISSYVTMGTLPGKKPPSETAIIAALAKRLAKFKLPKRVFLAGDLPRNAMGKVQKANLSKQYRETFKA